MNEAHFSTPDRAADIEYDAIVLGAGVSGLVSASVLVKQGCQKILVVDEYEHIGGNHMDWSANGYTFDIGSLIFQDDSPLLTHFPELLPLYVPIEPRWGRLTPQKIVTDYPISLRDDIFRAGARGMMRIFGSVFYARLFQREMNNAREFSRYWIGAELLRRSGLESYMRRFYGIALDQIDIELATKRMLWISEHASLGNLVRRLLWPKRRGSTNRQLARPKAGFAPLYRLAQQNLEKRGVQFALGVKPVAIDRLENGFRLRLADGAVTAARLFSTIPIEKVQALCAMERKPTLNTTTLIGLYFSFSGNRGFHQPIVYNFSHEGAWKRLTVYSDFYGPAHGREYFGVEVVAEQPGYSTEMAEADFRAHASANGLFRGDLKLEGSQVLTNAYPVYSRGAARQAEEAIAELYALGIQSYGRHGGFNYQPTARVSTLEAETALGFERKVSQPPEAVEVSPPNERAASPLLISSPTTP
ncbi:protoporphyrinogen oxidase [Neorhizobium galegae]|uniref:NAD(P)-binding protein n=1 Tax=Neorhizobium galegae TaxID=399 RepID=UPI002788DCDA|nr:NAD(P)-binding protein [Neorhizobium galegae]MDQ0134332.1 protoporphyrinogen oxidase [Neorhizobium galegae]